MNATRNPVVAAVADASDEMMAFDQASPNPTPVTTTAEDAQEVAAVRAPVAVATSDAERAAFEAWAGTLQSWVPNVDRIHPSGPYKSLATASAWSAWKARAALPSPSLPIDFKQATDQGGWQLVPKEPTPEIIAAAAMAVWPTAGAEDIALARKAAPIVLMGMDLAGGFTVDTLAASLATMAPAYRAMLAAAPTLLGVADGDAAIPSGGRDQ